MSQIVGWDEYTSDPEYQNLSRAEKVGLFRDWQKYAQDAMSEMGALSEQDDVDYFNSYAEEATKGILEDMDFGEAVSNAYNRGLIQAKQNLAMGLATAGVSPEEQAAKLAELEQEKNKYPTSWSFIETMKTDPKAGKLEQAGEYLKKTFNNPGTLGEVLVESLAAQFGTQAGIAPEFAAAGALATSATGPGAAAGAIGGLILSTGAASFANEYTSKFISTLREQGVDVEDPAVMSDLFQDPKKLEMAKEKAIAKGVPVAVFDTLSAAISFGIGSKVASGVVRGGAVKALEKTAEGGVKEVSKAIYRPMGAGQALGLTGLAFGSDVALGMAGEAAGQKLSEGQITDVPGVVAEGLAELAPGILEFSAGAVRGITKPVFVPTTEANQKAQQALQNIENRKVLAEAQQLQAAGAPETAKAVASTGIQAAMAEVTAPANEPQVGDVAPVVESPEQSLILLNELSGKLQKGESPLLTDETQKQTFQKLVETAPTKFRFETGPEGIKVLEVPGAAQAPVEGTPAPQPAAPQESPAAIAPALTEPTPTEVTPVAEAPKVELKPISITEGDFTFNFDPAELQTYYGEQYKPETEQDLKDLGTALAINLGSAYKALGSAARNRALTFNTIKTIQTSSGGGLYANPASEGDFNTLYVDPARLLSKIKSLEKVKGTAAVSQYLTDALAEEALHVQDGASLYSNYAAKNEKGEGLRARFGSFNDYYKGFFSRVTEEMTANDIDDTLRDYLGRSWSNLPAERKTAALQNRQLLGRIVGMEPWKIGAEFSRRIAQEGYGRKTEDLWNQPKPFLYSLLSLYRRYYDKLVGKIPAAEMRKSGVELVAKRFKNLNEVLGQAPEDLKRTVQQGDFLNSFDPTVFAEEEGRIEAEKTAFETDTLERANRWLSDDPTKGYRKYVVSLTNQMAPGLRGKTEYKGTVRKEGSLPPLDEIQVDALTELSRLASQYDPASRPENVDSRQHEMGFIRAGITNYLLGRKRSAGERAMRNLSLDIPLPKGTRAAGRGVQPKLETPKATEQEEADRKETSKRRKEAMRNEKKAQELKGIQTDEILSEMQTEPTEAGTETESDDLVEEIKKELESTDEPTETEAEEADTKKEPDRVGLQKDIEAQGTAMIAATAQDNPAMDAANDPVYDNEDKGPQFVGDTAVDEESSTEATVKKQERDALVGMVLNQMDPKLQAVYDLELEAMAENPGGNRDTLDKYGAKKLGITEDEYAELRQETFKNFRSKALSGRVTKDDLIGASEGQTETVSSMSGPKQTKLYSQDDVEFYERAVLNTKSYINKIEKNMGEDVRRLTYQERSDALASLNEQLTRQQERLSQIKNDPEAYRKYREQFLATEPEITTGSIPDSPSQTETANTFSSQDLLGAPNPDDVIADLATADTKQQGFQKWLRKWFSSRGLLPQSIFDLWVKAKQSEAGEFYQARENATEMRRLFNALGKNTEESNRARDLVNTVLTHPNEAVKLKARQELLQIDQKIHDITIEMRDHIDKMSLEMANLLHVPEKLRGAVLANLRTYLNRSYEIFDNPEWSVNLRAALNAPEGSKIVDDNAKRIINAARVWADNEIRVNRGKQGAVQALRKENQLRKRLGRPRYQDEWAAKFNLLNPSAKIDTTTKEGKKLADEKYRQSADFKSKIQAKTPQEGTATQGEVNRYLTKIIDQYRQPDIQALVRGKGNVFRKNLDILKYRENLPEALRQMLGEYTDPDAVYLRTAQKLSTFLAKDRFLSEFAELGKGVTDEKGMVISQKFLYDKESELPKAGDFVKFRADNPSYAPLDGKWMPRELADVLADHFKPELVQEKWFNLFRKATGLAMLAKTGYSVQATIRNFWGNVMQPVSNGHVLRGKSYADAFFNPKVLKEAATRSDNPIVEALRRKTGDAKAWSEEIKKLISLGVIGENVDANLIREFLQQDTFTSSGEQFADAATRGLKLGAKGFKEFNTKVNRFYASVDHFWKVLFFEAEKSRYSETFPGAPENLIEEYAAKVVRDTTFTYSMAPKIIREISKTGVLAPFVRFSSEVLRTVTNQFQMAREEIAGDTSNIPQELLKYLDKSKLRKSGWQRALGLSTTFVVLPGLTTAIGMSLGVDPDDEDRIRRYLPSYFRNAQIAVVGKDNKGEYKYINLSFINPYAYFSEVKNSLFTTDGDITDKTLGVLKTAFEPFISEQLVFGALVDVLRNRTSDGKEIFNPRDPDSATKIVSHVLQPFVPGTVQSAGRILEGARGEVRDSGYAPDFSDELLSTFTGQKITQGNIVEGWDRKVRGFKSMESDTERMFTKVLSSRGTVSPERLVESYQKMEDARFQLWQEFRADYEAARGLGMNIGQAYSILKANKVPEDTIRAVISGRYVPYTAGKTMINNAVTYPGGRERLKTYLTTISQEAAKRRRLVTTGLPN